MSKKIPSKDDALEALDFVVSVLKEHEKDLDRLINELGNVTEKMGDTGELSGKVERVEEKLGSLEGEITNLISHLSTQHDLPVTSPPQPILTGQKNEPVNVKEQHGPAVILRCKQWEDFQTMATGAQTASFMYKEPEKTFQVDAVKEGQIITYSGDLPKYNSVLKAWLSNQLNIPERKLLEGVLAIG